MQKTLQRCLPNIWTNGNTSFALFVLVISFSLSSCHRKIEIDRSQFIQDGEAVPEVDISHYRSVQERANQDADIACGMAISGGGLRAANFGMGVMVGLEKIQLESGNNVLAEIDYFSTVSGGGFASGAYANALYNHHLFHPKFYFKLENHWEEHIRDELSYSYAAAIIRSGLNPLSWFTYVDDGDGLEKQIDNLVLGYKFRRKSLHQKSGGERHKHQSILLGDVFLPKDSPEEVKYPFFVSNGSLLHKMGIIPFTPDVLANYKINGYTHRNRTIKNQADPYKMPLAVGVKASGSFPVLISNTTLYSDFHPERPYLHIIDGAMTDNFGYETALAILKQESEVKKKTIFIVDADNAGNTPTFSEKQKSIAALNVYTRLAGSGLEARRITLRKDAKEEGERYDIQPIFFSFNILIQDNEAVPSGKIEVKSEMLRLNKLLQEKPDSLTKLDLQILYELATHIETKYTINKEEQTLLYHTGQKIVDMQKSKILEALER